MFYGYGFVCKRCCCSSPDAKQPDAQVVTQPADVPSTPKPPPSSPVIEPVETPTYPDLPFINPSLVREDTYCA